MKSGTRMQPLEKSQKINKRRGTFIPDSRVVGQKKSSKRIGIDRWMDTMLTQLISRAKSLAFNVFDPQQY